MGSITNNFSITMGCKGQAGTAVFRSSVFHIYFLGLSKLVAVKPLAPEPGSYIYKINSYCRHQLKNIIKKIGIILFLVISFYFQRVSKVELYTGEIHYNLFEYYHWDITKEHVIYFTITIIGILLASFFINKWK
jgi:hypothetical protein